MSDERAGKPAVQRNRATGPIRWLGAALLATAPAVAHAKGTEGLAWMMLWIMVAVGVIAGGIYRYRKWRAEPDWCERHPGWFALNTIGVAVGTIVMLVFLVWAANRSG